MSLVDRDLFWFPLRFWNRSRPFIGTVIHLVPESMACSGVVGYECRDDVAALRLKLVAVAAILVSGIVGVATPIANRSRFRADGGGFFVLAKAFAAGVILATGFVHMLHDAEEALASECLPEFPWRRFPFTGFVAMCAALGTLMVDFVATQIYDRKKGEEVAVANFVSTAAAMEECDGSPEMECGDREAMHIVGMHAHKAEHRHSHASSGGACERMSRPHSHGDQSSEGWRSLQPHSDVAEGEAHARHVVVSQILELGIVSHSFIIGLSLGVSQSPCTIRPLVAALSFHQFFEGFALGGCISEAQFSGAASIAMCFFFAITTPAGIAVGAGTASLYNPLSVRALAVEGLLDSVSAGILIYMALVDLIAADFLSRRMSCNFRLQVASYAALFFGSAAMSSLAILRFQY